MKYADEILKNKKARVQEKLKEHVELVNAELLEIEKAINTYEENDEDTKPYIDIPMIIKTNEAKESLIEHKFYIDKVNQNIPYGTTRIYLDETSFNIATRRERKQMYIPEDVHKVESIKDKINNKEKNNSDDDFKLREISLEDAIKLIKDKQRLKNNWWNI